MKHYEYFSEILEKKDSLKEQIKLTKKENETQEEFKIRLNEHKLNMSEGAKKIWSWIKKVERLVEDCFYFEKNIITRNYEKVNKTELDLINQKLKDLENFSNKSKENFKKVREYVNWLYSRLETLKPILEDWQNNKKFKEEQRKANIKEYKENQKKKILGGA